MERASRPKDARLAAQSLRRMRPIPPTTSWVTYVRGHDDIGWAVSDTDAGRVGLEPVRPPPVPQRLLLRRFPGSHARGALFQENPETGDARISGSARVAVRDQEARERGDDGGAGPRASAGCVLLYAVAFSFGGIPLLYMGDELALATTRATSPTRARARTTGGCTGRDGRDGRRPPGRPGQPGGPRVRLDAAARPGAGASCPRCSGGGVGAARPSTTRTCSPGAGGTRAAALRRAWSTSPSTRCRWTSAAFEGLGELETVLSADGDLQLRDGRAQLPGLGFVWIAEA